MTVAALALALALLRLHARRASPPRWLPLSA